VARSSRSFPLSRFTTAPARLFEASACRITFLHLSLLSCHRRSLDPRSYPSAYLTCLVWSISVSNDGKTVVQTVTTAPSMISLSPPLKSIPYSIQSSSTVPPTSRSAFWAMALLRLCLRRT
jgi:hypothetical protein